jgi:hypothetical protein
MPRRQTPCGYEVAKAKTGRAFARTSLERIDLNLQIMMQSQKTFTLLKLPSSPYHCAKLQGGVKFGPPLQPQADTHYVRREEEEREGNREQGEMTAGGKMKGPTFLHPTVDPGAGCPISQAPIPPFELSLTNQTVQVPARSVQTLRTGRGYGWRIRLAGINCVPDITTTILRFCRSHLKSGSPPRELPSTIYEGGNQAVRPTTGYRLDGPLQGTIR